MIEDEDEKQILVSINDEVSWLFFWSCPPQAKLNIAQCPLLEGLERVHLPSDPKVLRNFQSRLKPFLGNLTMVHSALLSEKKIEVDSPLGVYEVDSWIIPSGKRAYCLVSYDQNLTAKS
jgi:hypothetical protein